MMRPCLVCGEPSQGTRCPDCAAAVEAARGAVRGSARARGYGTSWDRLSRRARKAQPWCNRCGSTERLTVHHTEQAWARVEAHKVVRLVDVEVLRQRCNNAAGTTRPTYPMGVDPHRRRSGPSGEAKSRTLSTSRYRGDR